MCVSRGVVSVLLVLFLEKPWEINKGTADDGGFPRAEDEALRHGGGYLS